MDRLLILSNVHVEPTSSAAGRRMLQIIQQFLSKGYHITYATTAAESPHAYDLGQLGIEAANVMVNDPAFDTLVQSIKPDVVLFDRFMVEEQFGWRIKTHCPDAIRLLDTEDLHCLRYARQAAVKEGRTFHDADLFRDVAYREIASILRCDLTLMISSVEMGILQRVFKVDPSVLHYMPFLEEKSEHADYRSFDERKEFVSIGSFRHDPNLDAFHVLRETVWPQIRKELPDARLHLFGSYANDRILGYSDERSGFMVHGRVEDVDDVMSKAKVLLAPLRFGAGLKGKLIDAMRNGTPSVTTSIGAEGMQIDTSWPGGIEDDMQSFANKAVKLYSDEAVWKAASDLSGAHLRKAFNAEVHALLFWKRFEELGRNLEEHRQKHFQGQLIWHHSLRSTEYMAKWIEAKNR